MRKIINSATAQYEPVSTDNLVLDDRPISGSFNGITSDAVYKAISVDPGNVPPVDSTDNGKVLTASYGEGGGSFAWATPEAPQSEIPEYSSTEVGKVLGVVADYDNVTNGEPATVLDWVDQPAPELPAQLGTAGQVLTVNSGATGVEWATPSGGSSFTLTKVGTVTDYLPTTGGLSLSFTTVSGQSNFIDPTKLYIFKVKVSCVDSGSLSFGSAPYLDLSSFNTEYNAVNRTHLSYAFPQIPSGSMSSSASTNTTVYFFDEVANNLHIAPTGGQENDLKITVGGVYSGSANSHRITVDLYMVN